MVNNISAGLILGYVNIIGKKKVSLEEMFKSLSLEMGGDGNTITKKQLDTYIAKAESGAIKVSNAKLKALKKLQEKWDDISKGKDSISFSDLKDFSMLLVNIVVGGFQDSEEEDSSKSDLKEYAKQTLGISDDTSDKSDLEAHLKSLLADHSNDDSNSDLVDLLTNLIAVHESNATNTISAEA